MIRSTGLLIVGLFLWTHSALAWIENPYWVTGKGKLLAVPRIEQRVPAEPRIMAYPGMLPGQYGGSLRLLMASNRDARQIYYNGYARLMVYDQKLNIVPDILKSMEVQNGMRQFTLTLRKGHRWSDGHLFTAEDFRYWWEDMAHNPIIYPGGLPPEMKVNGQAPTFEILSQYKVRYTWPAPNPSFLPALASGLPLRIYRPAHYLKQFHAKYVAEEELQSLAEKHRQRDWRSLHFSRDRGKRYDNRDEPVLQPWKVITPKNTNRMVFERNPYFHRVDKNGFQLPYIDRIVVAISDRKLIPAKAAAGEADLQARYLGLNNYTFLKQKEERHHFDVHLWKTGTCAQFALYPNLNTRSDMWRTIMRDVRFRRALSLAVNRREINQVIYYGLGLEANNTILPESPLYKPEYGTKWTQYDPVTANALLDEIGLKRGDNDWRILPNGDVFDLIIEHSSGGLETDDVLSLLRDQLAQIGIRVHDKTMQQDILRQRVSTGSTIMSLSNGCDVGRATASMPPYMLAPTQQVQLQWPQWGLFYESGKRSGKAPDMPDVERLMQFYKAWQSATNSSEKTIIWQSMLSTNADQVYTIGLISRVPQPILVNRRLRNVPYAGIYAWDPGAFFGIYNPDTFWFDQEDRGDLHGYNLSSGGDEL